MSIQDVRTKLTLSSHFFAIKSISEAYCPLFMDILNVSMHNRNRP